MGLKEVMHITVRTQQALNKYWLLFLKYSTNITCLLYAGPALISRAQPNKTTNVSTQTQFTISWRK